MNAHRLACAPALVLSAAILGACNGSSGAPWLTMPSRDSHGASYFPIAAATNHADVSCEQCHGTYDTFRKFDCVTCHAGTAAEAASLQAAHANEAGFPDLSAADRSVPSQACMLCHSDGTALGIDPAVHTQKYFPIGASSAHAALRCGECHANSADRTAITCAGCHGHEQAAMATAHTTVTAGANGYEFTSAKCLRCHVESDVKTVASHTPFLITGGAKHGSASRNLCLTCHANLRTDRPFPAAVFSNATCTKTCHAGAHKQGSTCWAAGCHPDGNSHGD
ncbi:MAG: cytochrome c3 family protein [Anaeromyxobacter sp.]